MANDDRETLFITFSDEDVEYLVKSSGRIINQGRIYEPDGKPTRCCTCDSRMSVEHLGRIMPGSLKLLCDDPVCISDYLIKQV
jgi:hypothetical protein